MSKIIKLEGEAHTKMLELWGNLEQAKSALKTTERKRDLARNMFWVHVEESNPILATDGVQFLEKTGEFKIFEDDELNEWMNNNLAF